MWCLVVKLYGKFRALHALHPASFHVDRYSVWESIAWLPYCYNSITDESQLYGQLFSAYIWNEIWPKHFIWRSFKKVKYNCSRSSLPCFVQEILRFVWYANIILTTSHCITSSQKIAVFLRMCDNSMVKHASHWLKVSMIGRNQYKLVRHLKISFL